jgi:DNA-directed RNA polymerase beta subunit
LGNTSFDVQECRVRGANYSVPLKIKVNLLQFHKSSVDKHKYNRESNPDAINNAEDKSESFTNRNQMTYFPNYILKNESPISRYSFL